MKITQLLKKLFLINKKDPLWKEKENFKTDVIVFGAQLFMLVFANSLQSGTHDYFYAQNGLFVSSLLIVLTYIATSRFVEPLFLSCLRKGLFNKDKLSFTEKGHILWGCSFGLALIGLSMVDMSFFHHKGVRIGAVVGIAFVKVIRSFIIK